MHRFELLQHHLRRGDDLGWHSCHSSNVDTEGVVRVTRNDSMCKEHLRVDLANFDVKILDTLELLLEIRQLMVVGGEHRLCANAVMDKPRNSPGDRYTVIRGRSASNFIQQDQTAPCGVVENVGALLHFHKEGALTG